jgi:hypothetical protein
MDDFWTRAIDTSDMRWSRSFVPTTLGLFCIAGCSGSVPAAPGAPPALPVAAGAARSNSSSVRRSSARIVIRIPRRKKRGAHFISPSTRSLSLAIASQGATDPVLAETVDLTPQSPGCSLVAGDTQCSLIVKLRYGAYVATVLTYDGLGGAGNVLSQAQQVPFTVAQGVAPIGITLNGVPHSLTLTSASPRVVAVPDFGFLDSSGMSEAMIVTAKDADGNTIVGAGSPAYTGTETSGSGWGVATPAPAAPNQVGIVVPGVNGSIATLKIVANYPDATCSQPGAVCSTSATFENRVQLLFVSAGLGSAAGVIVYPPPYGVASTRTLDPGATISFNMTMDSSGNLFVADCNASCLSSPVPSPTPDAITEFSPPYTAVTARITNGIVNPDALGFDPLGDLFVGSGSSGQVLMFASPYAGTPASLSPGGTAADIAVDASGNMFKAGLGNNTFQEYVPPYTGTAATIAPGATSADAIALDANANLFIASYGQHEILEYAAPYTSPAIATMPTTTPPYAVSIDSAGDVFVGTYYSVLEFLPPYTGSPVTIGTSGVNDSHAMVFDSAKNLYVLGGSPSVVKEYAPPYTGTPVATIPVNAIGGVMLAISP